MTPWRTPRRCRQKAMACGSIGSSARSCVMRVALRAQAITARWAFDPEGRRLRPGSRVHAGDWVVLWRPAFTDREPDHSLRVLYEDAHLLAVDKRLLWPCTRPPAITGHTVLRRLYLDYRRASDAGAPAGSWRPAASSWWRGATPRTRPSSGSSNPSPGARELSRRPTSRSLGAYPECG